MLRERELARSRDIYKVLVIYTYMSEDWESHYDESDVRPILHSISRFVHIINKHARVEYDFHTYTTLLRMLCVESATGSLLALSISERNWDIYQKDVTHFQIYRSEWETELMRF